MNKRQIWASLQIQAQHGIENDAIEIGMAYGVKRQDVEVKDLVNVVDAVSQMSVAQRLNSAVIVETAPRGTEVQVKAYPVATALEDFCQKIGVRVFHSLQSFLESR